MVIELHGRSTVFLSFTIHSADTKYGTEGELSCEVVVRIQSVQSELEVSSEYVLFVSRL